jgi:hypothetical protein
MRAVPLQERALAALDALPRNGSPLVFPAIGGGHFDLHNFRTRYWYPALLAAGIKPRRRVYDLRHTFATFALRAGISTFDLSRYMGASLTMIDATTATSPATDASTQSRCSTPTAPQSRLNVHAVDAGWTSTKHSGAEHGNRNSPSAGTNRKPSDGLEPSTPSLPSPG